MITIQDPARCCHLIAPAQMGFPRFHQCGRKWTIQHDGKHYCAQHDPTRTAEKHRLKAARFEAELKAEEIAFNRTAACLRACEGMADPEAEVADLKRRAAQGGAA